VEGLLETTVEPDPEVHVQAAHMKKSRSLEVYLDACDNDDDDQDGVGGAGDGDSNVSASVSDEAKKRNFVDKCINKMKSLMTVAGKKIPPDSKK